MMALAFICLGGDFLPRSEAQASFQQVGNTLVMSNGNVRLVYNLNAGTVNFYWNNALKIANFYSGVGLSTGYIKGTSYSSFSYLVISSNQVAVTSTGNGLPVIKQYITLNNTDSFLIRLDVFGSNLKANWMGPVVVDSNGSVDIGITNDNRALVVPFDNDGFVRYNAMPMNSSATGYEVGAFYDNTSRNGLVVGSVTHDTWKTGIFFNGANNKLNLMNVFGGATSPWDVDPHGYVSGNLISSPTLFVGFGSDWRVTMQNYAAANTNFVARLPWTNGVPFGWNSWGVIQQNISYTDAIQVSDYYYVNLMPHNFSDNGTVYINLDSYWDNLTPAQLQSFVNHCHAHGEKAGIYFGPFVWFGAATNATNSTVTGSTWHYSDALLRDSHGNFESSDGGLAMDPTHPGTRDQINYYINLYTNWGFDYVKLDFLSHGTFEGVHYDPTVTTGIQAYNQGMQYVLNAINGRMFISESIAPLFPYQYGHSRRISCDAETSRIGDTEYEMNSESYGWWLDNLYQFNDPDIMVFGNGATTNEAQSRLISGAVTGLMLGGDDLTAASGQAGAQAFLTNAAVNTVARVGQSFMPVEANTGSSAVNVLVRQDTNSWCIAVFNYSASAANTTVNLSRAGLPAGYYLATNLWDGTSAVVNGSFTASLNAKQSKLYRLTARTPASLRWSANNTGTWDLGSSANWINLSNSQSSVFITGDQVLFDDTVGTPATVNVSGTVSPAAVTVSSSNNNYRFTGSGAISGTGNLLKQGNSTLVLGTANNFSGSAAIGGGTLQMGAGALNSVSALTITNGGTLDWTGNTLSGDKSVSVSGIGVAGGGAIFNSGGDFYNQVLNITLLGDTTFGGSHRWDLANGSAVSGPFNITFKWAGGYAEWDTVTLANNVGNLEIAQGAFGIKGMGSSFGNPNATLTVDSEVDFWNSGFGPNSGYAKNIHVLSNAAFKVLTSPSTYFNANVTLENSANWNYFYGSGSGQTMNGTYTLNGIVHLTVEDSPVTFTNVISGSGGLVWDAYNNQAIFTASNTYSGPTVISGGLTLALIGNGSITHSSVIFSGGNTATNVFIDVSGRADDTLTLASGETLGGVGTVNGKLTVAADATIAPGGTNVILGMTEGANSTGKLTANGDITLNGTTVMKLNGVGVNDQIASKTSVSYGGILNVANISGNSLAVGNSFQLFSAPSYSGGFASIVPATPGPGLAWDTSQLSSGKLNVIAAPSAPVINDVKMIGNNFIFNGTNGGSTGSYVVLASTNLNLPLMNWVALVTNTFDVAGAFHITNTMPAGTPQLFYCLKPR